MRDIIKIYHYSGVYHLVAQSYSGRIYHERFLDIKAVEHWLETHLASKPYIEYIK